MVETRELQVSAGKIRYLQTIPQGKGPNMVFFHGGFGDPSIIKALEQVFGPKYRIIVPYLPGHGSFDLDSRFSYAGMVTAMCEFLESLKLPRYDLLGHSFGGRLALDVASDTGKKIKKEILFAPMLAPISTGITMAALNVIRDYQKDLRLSRSGPVQSDTLLIRLMNIFELWPMISSVNNVPKIYLKEPLIFWGKKDSVLPLHKNLPLISNIHDAILKVYPGAHFWVYNPSNLEKVKSSLSL